MRRRKNHERGAAAVEFALVSLILVTLVGVVFQFAVYLWAFQAASNGAREGARAWAVNPCATVANQAKVTTAVTPAARTSSVSSNAALTKASGNTASNWEPGDTVTVTVKMKPKALGFNLVPGWDFNADITKTATARVEDVQGCP
ncbi:TadE/TadG family type IV pilus assembly protein [Nocardioides sp. P5_E3]